MFGSSISGDYEIPRVGFGIMEDNQPATLIKRGNSQRTKKCMSSFIYFLILVSALVLSICTSLYCIMRLDNIQKSLDGLEENIKGVNSLNETVLERLMQRLKAIELDLKNDFGTVRDKLGNFPALTTNIEQISEDVHDIKSVNQRILDVQEKVDQLGDLKKEVAAVNKNMNKLKNLKQDVLFVSDNVNQVKEIAQGIAEGNCQENYLKEMKKDIAAMNENVEELNVLKDSIAVVNENVKDLKELKQGSASVCENVNELKQLRQYIGVFNESSTSIRDLEMDMGIVRENIGSLIGLKQDIAGLTEYLKTVHELKGESVDTEGSGNNIGTHIKISKMVRNTSIGDEAPLKTNTVECTKNHTALQTKRNCTMYPHVPFCMGRVSAAGAYFTDALLDCASQGGSIAYYTNLITRDFLITRLRESRKNNPPWLWLGMSYDAASNMFVSLDGEFSLTLNSLWWENDYPRDLIENPFAALYTGASKMQNFQKSHHIHYICSFAL